MQGIHFFLTSNSILVLIVSIDAITIVDSDEVENAGHFGAGALIGRRARLATSAAIV